MPTPSDSTPQLNPSALPGEISAHTTCPPETERGTSWAIVSEEPIIDDDDDLDDDAVAATSAAGVTAGRRPSDATSVRVAESSVKRVRPDEDVIMESMSPASASSSEAKEEQSSPTSQPSSSISTPSASSSVSYEFSNVRVSNPSGRGLISRF
jgi:hypothetical protein